jgi:competence protein ComEC
MIAGIIADTVWSLSATASCLPVVTGGLIFAIRRRSTTAATCAVILAAMGLGALRHGVADRGYPANHIVTFTQGRPILATVTGRVVGAPTIVEPDPSIPRAYSFGPKTRFLIQATQVAGVNGPIEASGKVQVSIKDPLSSIHAGDIVGMTGWLYRPSPPQNPGAYDWAAHGRRSGIVAGLSCDHGEAVRFVRRGGSVGWEGLLDRLRNHMRGYLTDQAFSDNEESAGVITAMVLGQRSNVSKPMNEAFLKTGNLHFLAASGMHVAWLALLGWGLCRLFGVDHRASAILVGILILAFVLVAEPRPSIMRAGIIGVLACAAAFLRGRYASVNALSAAAVIILLINPTDLLTPAFQFSFLATIGLLHFCPRITETIAVKLFNLNRLRMALWFSADVFPVSLVAVEPEDPSLLRSVGRRLMRFAAQLLALSISEWLITTPLACFLFGQFIPWGWFGTFVLAPFAMLTTCLGFFTVLLGLVLPLSGTVTGPLLAGATAVMIGCVDWLGRLPGSILDGRSPSPAWLLSVYALLFLWTYRPKWITWRPGFRMAVVVLIAWWLVAPYWSRPTAGTLDVWMLAVGDGTGTVIELPDGRVMIYDFGTRSPFDAGRVGVDFLRRRGIRRIDTVFVSHPDFDHYSGIETIAEHLPIGRVVINDQFPHFSDEASASSRFMEAIRERGIPIDVTSGPQHFDGGAGVSIDSLWPPPAAERMAPVDNDSSTVLRIAYRGKVVLLCGDVAEWGIAGLMDRGDLGADALALPHHGSVVHNTAAFINAVNPRIAVRSTGQRQAMTTNNIGALVDDRQFFNTAETGCVRLRIRDGEISARTMRQGF